MTRIAEVFIRAIRVIRGSLLQTALTECHPVLMDLVATFIHFAVICEVCLEIFPGSIRRLQPGFSEKDGSDSAGGEKAG